MGPFIKDVIHRGGGFFLKSFDKKDVIQII